MEKIERQKRMSIFERKKILFFEKERSENIKKIGILEKRIDELAEENQKVVLLEKRIADLEKIVLQTRLDFSRYRNRNK